MSNVLTPPQTLIFAGTPEFAAVALGALLKAGHKIAAVLTQPDRPAGRGMKLQFSAVKQLAVRHGIKVMQPVTLRDPVVQADLKEIIEQEQVRVMVVAAYGLILPQAVLDMPRFGCLNIHASLLPRWRGAAPIHRAIEAGDQQSGVGIMQMEAGLDTGPVLLEAAIPIDEQITTAGLHDQLADLGGRLIVDALAQLPGLVPKAQKNEGVTYAKKIEKAEAALDFALPAIVLARKIRAFDPFPGCIASLDAASSASAVIKIWRASVASASGSPGEVLEIGVTGVLIACGSGALRVTELQKAGGKRLPVAEFLAGFPLSKGQRFRSAA